MYNITYTTRSQQEPWDLCVGIIFSAVWYKFHDMRVRELCGTTNYLHSIFLAQEVHELFVFGVCLSHCS
jgi:hypothetical protein